MNLTPVVGKNLLLRFHIVTMVIYSLFKQLLSDENDEFPIVIYLTIAQSNYSY